MDGEDAGFYFLVLPPSAPLTLLFKESFKNTHISVLGGKGLEKKRLFSE